MRRHSENWLAVLGMKEPKLEGERGVKSCRKCEVKEWA